MSGFYGNGVMMEIRFALSYSLNVVRNLTKKYLSEVEKNKMGRNESLTTINFLCFVKSDFKGAIVEAIRFLTDMNLYDVLRNQK